jgi:hypothetical protein
MELQSLGQEMGARTSAHAVPKRLEHQFERKLPKPAFIVVTVIGCRAQSPLLSLDQDGFTRELRGVGHKAVDVHVVMVEQVKCLSPELQLEALREAEILQNRHVEVPRSGSPE